MKKRKKFYLIVSKEKKYLQGSTPYSRKGKKQAEELVKLLSEQKSPQKFLIIAKWKNIYFYYFYAVVLLNRGKFID